MQRLNEFSFYQLGTILHPLLQLKEGTKIEEYLNTLFMSQGWLNNILNNQLVPLKISKASCQRLLNSVNQILPKEGEQWDLNRELTWLDTYYISEAVKEFETVFGAELQSLDTYFISQKGIYSTPDLIEHADNLLSEQVKNAIPQNARQDIIEAGKCLAFDVPTAAGFHILRAIEAVIRQYYEQIVGEKPKPKMRNWGVYIRVLKIKGADIKVIASLDQIRELHRNPILHPEETLSTDDATTLFGIAQSAILAMVNHMEKEKQSKLPGLSLTIPR